MSGVIPLIDPERRRAARFAMMVPIQVNEIGTGSTIDISATGVSFVIGEPLEPGRTIRFRVAVDDGSGSLALHCNGTVVRVEQRGRLVLTAATIDQMEPDGTGH